ncbi:DNA helicase [Pediococcus damnosus]|uniref:DNA helicase n=1 Tax=Pediococcus damnosus TaxID=51663 RepID=A0AAC9B2H8_9LACO|nr:RNA polymerase recycling motor HelD [Pediococcus damnosus]AMV63283.1 DNA helicase [Pediococcus damnosus]AMV66821.1 DNA helicase [Pediococcus damnosus]KJU74182.1 ATP-dependent DNA helicase [Pediococcus damnosus LMG 28219]KRN53190.1 dna helicase [Pediococcus damnosus]PIO81523.1 ATP-dependent DNA helicase [Pediococcus damnosus]
MSTVDPEEFQREQQRVDDIIKKIGKQADHTKKLYNQAHNERRSVEGNYSQNAKINTFEADDRIETNAEVQQQKGLVASAVENETILNRQVATYKQLQKSPYFGRIDIQDPDESEPETLYIGTASFTDEHENFLIYDWRAPISSVYYNGSLGKVSYQAPAGKMTTDLIKKRQFSIQNGKIKNLFDTNEIVGDEILQEVLGQQNDTYMANIVATIQKEQNDIIRDTTSDLLVVQGVAGSGKTSAILQRIAFLLYHSRQSLNAEEIVLFSPNRLYSRYISDVLPSLGEHNMRQITLADFLSQRFQGLNVESLFDRYEKDDHRSASQQAITTFEESTDFMQLVTDYVANLTADDIQFSNVLFNEEPFFTADEIREIYRQLPTTMAPADRFLKTKNTLIKRLKNRIDKEADADWVHEQIDHLNNEQYNNLTGTKKLHDFENYDDEIHYIGRKLVAKHFQVVYDALYNNYFIDPYTQFMQFLKQVQLPEEISTKDWQAHNFAFQQSIEFHKLHLIDAAPLLLMRDLITGGGRNRQIQHIFVDEMQDYSLAQMIYFKHAFPNAKFTLLGDSEQALFKNVEAPQRLLDNLKSAFAVRRANLITLNRSYRSTFPITNFAKALLPDGDQIQAFSRDGSLPTILIRDTPTESRDTLIDLCKKQLQTYGTVAILTRNIAESQHAFNQIHQATQAHLLTDTDLALPKGVLVMPVYLAKGLEFDSVIAYNISKENYPDASSTGIIYTMASRAMHQLTLLSIGPVSPLVQEAVTSEDKLVQIQ